MTTIKTEINGQPFEIEVADGLKLEFSDGRLNVTRVDLVPYYPVQIPAQPIVYPSIWPSATICDVSTGSFVTIPCSTEMAWSQISSGDVQ